MGRLFRLGFALALLLAAGRGVASGQESEVTPHAQDRPPGPPKSPAEAVAAMTAPEGFTVELVAAEPNLVNPVAMTFDERGRIWVTESLEYPRREPGPGRDRVKVLEDTDGDGQADRFTIFAEGLNIPSGIAVGHGGVWVANAPDILFYPDANRDGVADGPPQVVVTGFGRADTHELPNALTWGPDGWLYGWNGVFNPSAVKDHHGFIREFTCAIFRIHPKTRAFEVWCEGTSNPWGIAINENGDLFASACVIDHLWHLTESGYYIRQGGPYPPHTMPLGSIVDHKHQKAAYCGITYFDSPAYPAEYRGRLYMGNIHGNCINVDVLERKGASYRGVERPDFLSANDAWFMPVSQKTGPDGCLYVLDWYDRYHCYQDANRDPAGIDRLKGRLYRVRYQNTARRAGFDLAALSDEELIGRLGDPNIYDRDNAQRLLTERLNAARGSGNVEAASADPLRVKLKKLVFSDASRPARMHALWAWIGGTERLPNEDLMDLMGAADPTIRAWGVRAAGNGRNGGSAVRARVVELARDPSPDVRLQVAIAAPKLAIEGRGIPTLFAVLAASEGDPLIPHIVWENLKRQSGAVEMAQYPEFLETAGASKSPAVAALWPLVIERAATLEDLTGATLGRLFLLGLDRIDQPEPRHEYIAAMVRQLDASAVEGRRLELLRKELAPMLGERLADDRDPLRPDFARLALACGDPSGEGAGIVRGIALDGDQPTVARVLAATTLIDHDLDDAELLDALIGALAAPESSEALRAGLFDALSRTENPTVGTRVLAVYDRLPAEARPRAIELLSQRPTWGKALLEAVASGRVPTSALGVNQLRRLQSSSDPSVREAVRRQFGTVRESRNPKRELIVGQMRNFLRKTPGDAQAGQAVFTRVCGQCHVIYGQGQEVGPDITLNGRNDFEQLISNVFDPNLVIGPAYQATTVAAVDGRVLTGLLAEDSAERVVLKVQGGAVETLPREEVEEQKTAAISLMPEEIEAQLTPGEIADLFAFLALDRPPDDPRARRLPGAPAPSR